MNDADRLIRSALALSLRIAAAVSAAAAATVICAADAEAVEGQNHRVVFYTEGARGAEVASFFKDGLPPNVDVVSTDAFKAALLKEGQKTPLGVTLTIPSKRGAILAKIGKAAAAMGVEVVLVGYVQKARSGLQELTVLAVEANKGEASIDSKVVFGKGTAKAEVATALEDLANAWRSTSGTAPPTPSGPGNPPPDQGGGGGSGGGGGPKVGPAPDDEDGEWVRPKNVYGHEIFQINASFDAGLRFFDYNDGITPNLRDYNVFWPGVSARLEVFPLAPTGIVVLRDIGFVGEFRMQPGVSSETNDGVVVDTQWLRFGGGLRYRLPLGPKEKPFVLGLKGTFVQQSFTLEVDDEALQKEVPSVNYLFVRVGLDGRFPIGPVAITAFGGYLGAIESGEVHERFRDSSIGGIDVGGGLTVPIIAGLEARVQAEYVRWFYAFGPVPGDEFVAGGALDEYIHIEIGPQYVF